jgi:hypothetical protein
MSRKLLEIQKDLPLDPIAPHNDVRINMLAFRTGPIVISNGSHPPQDNTHLNNHSWFHLLSQFDATNPLIVFSVDDFIIAPLHVTVSSAIFAVASDNTIEVLFNTSEMCKIWRNHHHEFTSHVEQNVIGTGILCPR